MKGKKKKMIIALIVVLGAAIFAMPKLAQYLKWRPAVEAAGGLPYQIGLTKAAIIQCITTGNPPICTGGPLCATLDAARCAAYSEVNGMPAGGMGTNALFSNAAITKAGLTPGGQLIAGGLSPALMDQGVLASAGGCYGCVTKNNLMDKIFNWFDRYIIAGIRDKIK